MLYSLKRYKTPGFKEALTNVVMHSAPLPQRYQVDKITLITSTKKERKVKVAHPSPNVIELTAELGQDSFRIFGFKVMFKDNTKERVMLKNHVNTCAHNHPTISWHIAV